MNLKHLIVTFCLRHSWAKCILTKYGTLKHIIRIIRQRRDALKASHTPDSERKHSLQTLLERLFLCWKYGPLGSLFYFSLGLDRKGEKLSDHITEGEFIPMRDFVNSHYPSSTEAYPRITRDKILSKKVLAAIGGKTALSLGRIELQGNDLLLSDDFGNEIKWEQLHGRDIFSKPVSSECGHGIMRFHIQDSEYAIISEKPCTMFDLTESIKSIISLYGPVMLEECIRQHPLMEQLYPLSVNTLRVSTVHTADGIGVLGKVCRIGAHGNRNDNYSSGGIIIGIDNNGTLLKRGFMRPEYGDAVLEEHPDTGTRFENFQIPFYDQAIELCTSLHSKLSGIFSIGWDIAIREDGPIVIEMNDNWEIQLYEICYEKGYRREYTETFIQTARKLRANTD